MKKIFSLILTLCTITALSLTVNAADAQLQEAYDARDDGIVTSVKSQGPYGTCWAHAVCAVAETNMIKKGLADQDVDYSEIQLAYFASQKTDDPLGNYTQEGMYLVGSAVNNTYLSAGGDPGLAGYTLMRGTGLVNEELVPYGSAEDVLMTGLDPSYAYDHTAARLTDIYYISFSKPDEIKQAILDNGAVCTTLYDASSSRPEVCYNPETAAYYKTDPTLGTQHSVAIIGWDDNYSVDNFLPANKPSNPGAWLIKDSAGTDWGDQGYWWASYEDLDFNLTTTKNVAVLSFDDPGIYDHTYQYDGSSRNSSLSLQADTAYMANIFTATADEEITAVSFSMSQYRDINYDLYIFMNPAADSPSSGTQVYHHTATVKKGYITVPLSERVSLKKGDRFSVIIGYSGADSDGYMWMDYDVGVNDGYFAYAAYCEPGQSFYTSDFVNYAWTDYAKNSAVVNYFGQANFRIKAHTQMVSQEKYTLTVTNGTDVTGEGSYAEGTVVAIKADTAPDGKQFKEWTVNGGALADASREETELTMPAGDVEVTAVYEDIPITKYTLTVTNGTDVTGEGSYEAGTVVAIKADAAPDGMQFKEWTADGGTLADAASEETELTMPAGDVEVTAVYEDIPVILPECIYMKEVNLTEGERVLLVGGYAIGVQDGSFVATRITEETELLTLDDTYYWNFEGKGSTWKIISKEGLYLQNSGTSLLLASNPATWQYSNGKFYNKVTTYSWIFKRSTTYYLSCNGSLRLETGTSNANSAFYMLEKHSEHNYVTERVESTCQQSGSETQCCSYCGDILSTITLPVADHVYGDNHLCTWCGQRDPDAPEESIMVDVKVNVKKTSSFIFFSRYQVTIRASAQGGSIAKVEYSLNNGTSYQTGESFTTKQAPGNILVRITDSNGGITNWKYNSASGTTDKIA